MIQQSYNIVKFDKYYHVICLRKDGHIYHAKFLTEKLARRQIELMTSPVVALSIKIKKV